MRFAVALSPTPSSFNPVGNSHSSVRLSFVSIAKDVTGAQATRPSGESVGLPMRLICQSAVTSSGGNTRERLIRRAGMRKAFG